MSASHVYVAVHHVCVFPGPGEAYQARPQSQREGGGGAGGWEVGPEEKVEERGQRRKE